MMTPLLLAITTAFGRKINLPVLSFPSSSAALLKADAWSNAAKVSLDWNVRDQQPADQTTVVQIATNGRDLYVRFIASQKQPIQDSQHTNDVSLANDDYVAIDVWPNGSNGFAYTFEANPVGSHISVSSENTGYAPNWQSAGAVSTHEYTVVMKIPISAIKSGGSSQWRIQFARYVAATQDDYVWQHAPQLTEGNDANVLYSGLIGPVPNQSSDVRPMPRIGLYALGEAASRAYGGSTSRVGADISIPLAEKTSFVATLHPDYSNVELDQQTIAPTAYQRYYQDVRPFFSQLDNYFNAGPCISCTFQEFYSPAIPTPRDGYAIEGKQGPFSYAAFDAVGANGRLDQAQTLSAHTSDTKNALYLQRDAVNLPGLSDVNTLLNVSHDSLKGLFEYAAFGNEAGSLVPDRAQAQRKEVGLGTYNRNASFSAVLRQVGAQYTPLDGYVANADIAGYALTGSDTWYYKPTAFISRFIASASLDRYHGSGGGIDQSDSLLAVGADLARKWHVRAATGSSYLLLGDLLTPISQNGIDLFYNYHTPVTTQISWYTGRFGPGRVDSWLRNTTFHVGKRGFLSLEADSDTQYLADYVPLTSWLEKVSYTYERGANASLSVGLRRIIGQSPILLPRTSSAYTDAWNLSLAYHQRLPQGELYLVYGDANALNTAPRLVLKFIQYVGAGKGT